MVHFPPFTVAGYVFTGHHSIRVSLLIRGSPDRGLFTAPRGFSQLITPFFDSWRQGILRVPLVAWHRRLTHRPIRNRFRAGFLNFAQFVYLHLSFLSHTSTGIELSTKTLVDFLIANRFQLSKNGGIKPGAYRGTAGSRKGSVKRFMQTAEEKVVDPIGIEPTTSSLQSWHSPS